MLLLLLRLLLQLQVILGHGHTTCQPQQPLMMLQ